MGMGVTGQGSRSFRCVCEPEKDFDGTDLIEEVGAEFKIRALGFEYVSHRIQMMDREGPGIRLESDE
jgi:hypothetical protein